jgi:hypothetical protein
VAGATEASSPSLLGTGLLPRADRCHTPTFDSSLGGRGWGVFASCAFQEIQVSGVLGGARICRFSELEAVPQVSEHIESGLQTRRVVRIAVSPSLARRSSP